MIEKEIKIFHKFDALIFPLKIPDKIVTTTWQRNTLTLCLLLSSVDIQVD